MSNSWRVTGFASSSALCLFLSIVSHLTTAGTDWAGSVSLASLLVVHSLSISPSRWFLTSELSPVYHMSWCVSLASAAVWGPALVSVMLFPYASKVNVDGQATCLVSQYFYIFLNQYRCVSFTFQNQVK